MKIVLSKCYVGFELSDKGVQLYNKLSNQNIEKDETILIERNCEHFVKVIEYLGSEASDNNSNLKVVEIPDNMCWTIVDCDGFERVCYSKTKIHQL